MAMIARAYPVADRGRALGLWAAASTLTTAPGPVLGGMFITWGGDPGWRLPRHLGNSGRSWCRWPRWPGPASALTWHP
ncbi:MAG: hypothetical protein V4551_04520 [Pseudomonadota bacterium]